MNSVKKNIKRDLKFIIYLTIKKMKTKTLILLCTICCIFFQPAQSQTPVPEDYFDLFDDEEDDGNGENDENKPTSTSSVFSGDKLDSLLNGGGALGQYVLGVKNTTAGGTIEAPAEYLCAKRITSLYYKAVWYELGLKAEGISCYEKKSHIQDYLMFLLTLNLETYCVDLLHPEANTLNEVELINVMLAFDDQLEDDPLIKTLADTQDEGKILLEYYNAVREHSNPLCMNDLFPGKEEMDCGTFIGEMNQTEKAKVIKDLGFLIDGLNPIWQANKAIALNKRLEQLPCK